MKLISGREKHTSNKTSVQYAFFIACLTGSFTILMGIYLSSIWLSILLPIGIMYFYKVYLDKTEPDLSRTVVGDSYYYLGFILTLVSLVISLMSLSTDGDVNLNTIVGSFGAALSTTIVGLILRLITTAFSSDAQTRRERLEDALEKNIDKLTAQLETLSNKATASLQNTHSQAEKTLSEILEEYHELNKSVVKDFGDTMSNVMTDLDGHFEKLGARIDSIELPSNIISEPISSSVKELTDSIGGYQQSVHNVTQETISINQSLVKKLKKTDELIIENMNSQDEKFQEMIDKHLKGFNQYLKMVIDDTSGSFKQLDEERAEMSNSMTQQMKLVKEHIDQFSGGAEQFNSVYKSAADSIKGASSELIEEMSSLSGKYQEISTASLKIPDINVLNARMEALSKKMIDVAKQLAEYQDTINGINEASKTNSVQLANDISSIYSSLSQQVKSMNEVVRR